MKVVSLEEKENWISGVGSHTKYAVYARRSNDFLKTSCLLTAAVMRFRINGSGLWRYAYDDEKYTPTVLTETFVRSNKTFQIAFGWFPNYTYHVLTVHDGIIYQSFYKETDWSVKIFDISHFRKEDLNSTNTISLLSLSSFIGFDMTEPNDVVDHCEYILNVPY